MGSSCGSKNSPGHCAAASGDMLPGHGGLVQSLSPARPCVTHGLPGPSVLHSLLELAQTRVH